MIIGVTGSRNGGSDVQMAYLASSIRHPSVTVLHHGDCFGIDESCHFIAIEANKDIVIHPPNKDKYRAFCHMRTPAYYTGTITVLTPESYADRDEAIVVVCNKLIAAPNGPQRPHSGTWLTITIARRIGRNGTIIYPNGKRERI